MSQSLPRNLLDYKDAVRTAASYTSRWGSPIAICRFGETDTFIICPPPHFLHGQSSNRHVQSPEQVVAITMARGSEVFLRTGNLDGDYRETRLELESLKKELPAEDMSTRYGELPERARALYRISCHVMELQRVVNAGHRLVEADFSPQAIQDFPSGHRIHHANYIARCVANHAVDAEVARLSETVRQVHDLVRSSLGEGVNEERELMDRAHDVLFGRTPLSISSREPDRPQGQSLNPSQQVI